MLGQQDGSKNWLGYCSGTHEVLEQNFEPTHPECIAAVWTIHLSRRYSGRPKFTIPADYDALKWVLNRECSTERLATWGTCLSEFDFDVMPRLHIKEQV